MKVKPSATIHAGGVPVVDERFSVADWPIKLEVPSLKANEWLHQFKAECTERGWNTHGLDQMGARENSGSLTARSQGLDVLCLAWDRPRDGPLEVRVRSLSALGIDELSEVMSAVESRAAADTRLEFYRRGQLYYYGLPWKGEIWFSPSLSLGPPSEQYDGALLGPRVIIVDAAVRAIDLLHANALFHQQVAELSAFLSVLARTRIDPAEHSQKWTCSADGKQCEVRQVGYIERAVRKAMPKPGEHPKVPLTSVSRPDFSHLGIDASSSERCLPADAFELWNAFQSLTPSGRQQFLRSAAKWQEALYVGGYRPSLSFALMVVACEALKPDGPKGDKQNIYNVVKDLLGKKYSTHLRNHLFDAGIHEVKSASDARNANLHRGRFLGSEFSMSRLMTSTFDDPTFHLARDFLARIVPAAIVEWLLREAGAIKSLPAAPIFSTA